MQVQIGAGLVIDVDTSILPANATEHAVYIGLRNILMDAHASVTKDDFPDTDAWQAAKRAMAEKKLAALMAGDVRVGGIASRGPVDPVEAIVVRIAREAVRATLAEYAKSKGKKVNAFLKTVTKEYFNEKVTDHIERNRDRLEIKAHTEIAEKAEQAAAVEIDFSEFEKSLGEKAVATDDESFAGDIDAERVWVEKDDESDNA